MIYLDNAATSWPKPESVYRATDKALRSAANPGRSGHQFSRASAGLVLEAREGLARFFGVQHCRQIIFTAGATDSLNMVLYGLTGLKKVISTGFEHNSLWRPLEDLARRRGVHVEYMYPDQQGVDWASYQQQLEQGADLVTITHASNVTGQMLPLRKMAQMAKAAGAMVCVDIAQTAGVVPLDFEALGLDFVAFPGHKGLLAPQGVGGLYVAPGRELQPLRRGGTGNKSRHREPANELPDRYEAGTLNVPAIAGLAAAVGYLQDFGINAVWQHERELRDCAVQGLAQVGAEVYGYQGDGVGVLSFNLPGLDSAEIAHLLDSQFNICVRGGLHCSPQAHQALNTIEQGVVRVSPGVFNSVADIEALVSAVEHIQRQMA